jgi:hypothetical protein
VTEQTVRLRFLGEAGSALLAQDKVIAGTRRLSSAQREQAAAANQAAGGARTLERDLGKASRGAVAGSGALRSMGRSIAFASTSFLGAYGLVSVIRSSVEAMKEASANAAVTGARLKATGGAAGVTAKQIDVLAAAVLRKTGYDKQAVVAAENVLLTFTQVRNELGKGNDIYTRAVRLTADLARATGEDLASAALKLGAALNDPERGLTRLQRAGIQFTKAQREQVTALTESGRILEAQRLILDSVAGRVGGVATAYGDTLPGKLGKARGEFRLLEEDLARALLPDLDMLVTVADRWARKLEEDKPAQQAFRRDVEGAAHAVEDIVHALHEAVGAVGGVKNALELLVGLKFASWVSRVAADLKGLIGAGAGEAAAAEAGTGLVGARLAAAGLLGTLTKLQKLGAIVIGVEFVTHGFSLSGLGKAITKPLRGLPGPLGHFFDPNYDDRGRYIGPGPAGPTGGLPAGGQLVGRPGAALSGDQLKAYIVAKAKQEGLDPRAVLAIASVEGGFAGAVGDKGTSFGPFQLHVGGALPVPGWRGAAFANSPEGIDYAIRQIGGVARGLKGMEAIAAIASKFERPADVQAEITKATLRYYRGISYGPGSRTPPPRRGPGQLPILENALAQAGVTRGSADDRAALQALISYYRKQAARPGLPITQQTADLLQQGSYQAQLDALSKSAKAKTPAKASAAALVNIHHTLDAVSKLVDQAGLEKRFDPALARINKELAAKFVTPATLAKIRNQLSDISKAAGKAIDNAKQQLEQRRQSFADAWSQLASDAFAAFDRETSEHVGPTRAILNQLISEHDQAQISQAVTDARKALDDALAGQSDQQDSAILSSVRDIVAKAALANAIDKAQSAILGISPQEIASGGLIGQLQSLLAPGGGKVVDPEAVKQAQRAYDDAVYQQKVFDLGKQADLEDSAYADARAALRDALSRNLDAWNAYYQAIGEKASAAAGDFARVWAGVLAQFPIAAGGTAATGSASTGFVTLSPGFNVPAGVIGAGFGGAFQHGGEGMVTSPTLFLAGEAGPERYRFTPGRGDSSTGEPSVVNVHLYGDLADDALVKRVTAEVGRGYMHPLTRVISKQIGKAASDRLRSGRY